MDLIVTPERAAEMKATAKDHASLTLDERSLCDLELLSVGGFSPLAGFWARLITTAWWMRCGWPTELSGRCRSPCPSRLARA